MARLMAACGRADDRTLAQLRDDDEEARERVLDRLGSRVLTVPGRWRELASFVHGEPNQLLDRLSVPPVHLAEVQLRAEQLHDVLKPFVHLPSLYLQPNIPDKKLRNARKFCEVPDEEDGLAVAHARAAELHVDLVLVRQPPLQQVQVQFALARHYLLARFAHVL